jgi:hypothetical protein
MAFDLKRAAIKAALPIVKDFLPMFDPAIADYRQSWIDRHKLETGEDIACMIFQKEGITYITFCVLTSENYVRAQLETMSFNDFVIKLIDTYKNKI